MCQWMPPVSQVAYVRDVIHTAPLILGPGRPDVILQRRDQAESLFYGQFFFCSLQFQTPHRLGTGQPKQTPSVMSRAPTLQDMVWSIYHVGIRIYHIEIIVGYGI